MQAKLGTFIFYMVHIIYNYVKHTEVKAYVQVFRVYKKD